MPESKNPVVWRDGRTIYHTLDCNYIAPVLDDGFLRVATADEAFRRMLKPCRRCTPPRPRAWLHDIPSIPFRRINAAQVEVVCCHCGERHFHGVPTGDYSVTGHRHAHCGLGQYRLAWEVGG